jgi:UV DNA damage endonuclease
MSQCIYITTKKTQCSRKAVTENLCTQHHKICNSTKIINNSIPLEISKTPYIYSSDQKYDFDFTKIDYIAETPNYDHITPYTNIINKYSNSASQDDNTKIILGLCCIIQTLRNCKKLNGKKLEIFAGRTINTRIHYTPEKAVQKAIQNILDLGKLINYCSINNIKCFRIGSDIFPRYDDLEVQPYSLDFAKLLLKQVGDFIKLKNIRVLMHPCQLVNIGSPDEKVLESSIRILEHHCDILDMLGIDNNGVLIIHGGGTYGDKSSTIERWIKNFNNLSERVKNRLVIENCERNYNIRDCLNISKRINIPVVFDTHHFECYNLIYPNEFKENPLDFLSEVVKTWKDRTVVMHVSNQRADSRIGAHSDFIDIIPEYLFEFVSKNKITIHLEQEAKSKELSLFRTRKLYGELVD